MIVLTLPYPISAKFGALTVLSRDGSDRFGRSLWKCKCDCGTEKTVALFRMKSGRTKSCGCAKIGHITHGFSRTPTHNSWVGMKQRCNYPGHDSYADYGGRGIKVCDRWDDFANFLSDMGEKPVGMTLERIDTDGDYEPGNCKWATMKEQNRNRRSTIYIARDGLNLCIKDWADRLGINPDRIYEKIRRGMTPQKALEEAACNR